MKMEHPRVLEVGTLRWEAANPTHHAVWHSSADWVMSDVGAGIDVDVVADAHDFAPFNDDEFDAFVAVSVWEHLERPWEAGIALARILRPGGIAFIMTHQTFPVHGYPSDFFRYTEEGLVSALSTGGLVCEGVGYQYPAQIIPPPEVTRWNPSAPVFLNVAAYMRKPI
jgi:SAM-dependent methyltransferase